MAKSMRAAVACAGEKLFRLEDLPMPELYDSEVLMKVEAPGISSGQTTDWRMEINISGLPRPIGMHMSDEVVAVGSAVSRVVVGDRIKPDRLRHPPYSAGADQRRSEDPGQRRSLYLDGRQPLRGGEFSTWRNA